MPVRTVSLICDRAYGVAPSRKAMGEGDRGPKTERRSWPKPCLRAKKLTSCGKPSNWRRLAIFRC